MFRILLLLIIIVPALEIAVLLLSGNIIGIWPTIFLIIATGILGAWLAKREGLQAVHLAKLQTEQGQLPNGMLLDGICILIGGIFLLTPGFITDAFGFFLLIPTSRTVAKALLIKLFNQMIKNGQFIIINRNK